MKNDNPPEPSQSGALGAWARFVEGWARYFQSNTGEVVVAATVMLFILAALAFLSSFAFFPLILGSAALGSLVDQSSKKRPVLEPTERLLYRFWKVITAWIFALLLMTAFASGLVQGALFPNFRGIGENYTNIGALFNTVYPSKNMDVIKMIFWAFTAGYVEQFVPSMVDSFRNRAAHEERREAETQRAERKNSVRGGRPDERETNGESKGSGPSGTPSE